MELQVAASLQKIRYEAYDIQAVPLLAEDREQPVCIERGD